MPFNWEDGTAAKFSWDSGESVSAPLPDLAPPKVDMKPQGSWLVRGLGAVSNAYKPPMAAAGHAALPVDADKPREWTPDPDFLDKPLISIPEPAPAGPDAGTVEKVARGLGQSAARNISALSSPRNTAIVGGLAAANAAGLAFPPLQPLVQAGNATAATYFANDMLGALPKQVEAYQGATDAEEKARFLGDIAATSMMAAGIFRGGVEAARPTAERMAGVKMQPDATQNPQSVLRSAFERDKMEKAAKAQAEAEALAAAEAQKQAEKAAKEAEKQARAAEQAQAKAKAEAARDAKLKKELGPVAFDDIVAKTETVNPEPPPSGRTNLAEDPFIPPEYLDQKPEVTMGDIAEKTDKVQDARLRRESQRGSLEIPNPFAETEVLSPEQQWADQYAKAKIAEREATRGGIARRGLDAFKEGIAKIKAEAVDSLSPILDAVDAAQKKHKFEIMPKARFEYWADRSLGSREMAERFMRNKGLLEVIRAPENRESLDRFDQYLIAKEAVRESWAQRRDTGRHAESDQRYVNAWKDQPVDKASGLTYDQLSDKFYEYNNALLDYSVESGLISKDMAESWRKDYGGKHVPLARVFDAIESTSGGRPLQGRQVANLAKQTVFDKRKGSLRPIDNPMFEMMERTRAALSQGERNQAAAALAGYAQLPGMKNLIREVPHGADIPQHSFSFLEDGRRRVFETTPEIAAAAKSLDAQTLGWLGKIVGYPARTLRFFTTGINPAFAAANVGVDIMTTAVTSKAARHTTANPAVFMKALMSALKHDETWSRIEAHGAGFTQLDLYRNTREHTIDAIRAGKNAKEMGRYIASHPVRSAVELFRAAEDIVSRSEQTGRARTFLGTEKAELAKGHTPENAEILSTIAANNELPNYRRSGSTTRAVNGLIVYLNAGIQGSRNLVRAIKERPAETSAKIAVGLYLPVALTTVANMSDPKSRKIYNDIRQYEKDNNLIYITPWAKLNEKTGKYEGIIKVKLAPGLSNLTVPIRRNIEALYGEDPMAFADIAEKMIGAVSPIEPNERGIASALPQAIKPGIQALSNYDFFRGGPKVPRRLENLPKEQQVLPQTSGTIRKLANSIGRSPILTEEFVKDTIGGSAPWLINAVDRAAAKVGVIPESEIGGTTVGQSVGARFMEARGGELDQKIYDRLKLVTDKAANGAVEQLKQSPAYKALPTRKDQLEAEQKLASRIKAKVASMSSGHKGWDAATPEQQMAQLEYIDSLLGGVPVVKKPRISVPMLRK